MALWPSVTWGNLNHMTILGDSHPVAEVRGVSLPKKTPDRKLLEKSVTSLAVGTATGTFSGEGDATANRTAVPAVHGHVSERQWPQSLRVGYAAGAYDLFHIGHLNILRQAKQRCDYLIAGVVSDKMLKENKGIDPFIPEDERLAIVQSIEFVDEAILETLPDKLDTWHSLRFTVFFKGDDWRGTPKGLDLEERFDEVGVDIEYLPYTLHTSSTKLRLALENFERVARSQ